MKITNPITLDVARSNSYICLLGKQFDSNSRYLQVTLTNNGQPLPIPSGAGVVLRATKADGAGSMTAGTVNGDGTALVEIDETVLEVAGAASLSIEVTSGGQVLTSASCNLTVQKADASGWVKVYVAAASVSAGTYYITIAGQSYSFTTTQAIPAGGAIYFNSEGGTAQTRDASGNVLDASLTLTAGTSGTELTSDVPTMSFLTAIAGRMATIEAEMSQKANIDGSYPLLHAGTADNLMTDNGATQAIPFIQEGTGKGNGEATVKAGGVLQLKKKLGNTVGVNQLARVRESRTVYGLIFTNNDDGTATLSGTASGTGAIGVAHSVNTIESHKYLVRGDGKNPRIVTNVSAIQLTFEVESGEAYNEKFTPIIIDLTLWYGSPDRIPSDLLSHPENWGRYYAGSLAYNAGTLDSADGTILTSIHRNIWDEEWEVGVYNNNTGEKIYASGYIRSKNKISVIPNTQYYTNVKLWLMFYDANGAYISYLAKGAPGYFTIPANCHQLAFNVYDDYGGAYKNDITISLYYPGESGYDQYYPFSVLAEVDTGGEVLRSGIVADEKTPDGTITRRVEAIDLGTLTWTLANTWFQATNALPLAKATAVGERHHLIYGVSATETLFNGATSTTILQYGVSSGGSLRISKAPPYDNMTAAQFQAAMSGVWFVYELATPTTEQGTAFAENIPCDDFGSLMWTQTKGIPQGNEIFYPTDLKGDLESILTAIPSANGTYTLRATVTTAGVTFSWS